MDFSKIERLMALKRREHPRPGFLDDVEHEFHHRLRAEMLRAERYSLAGAWRAVVQILENAGAAFSEPVRAVRAFAYAGAGAFAAWVLVAGGLFQAPTSPTLADASLAARYTGSTDFAFAAVEREGSAAGESLSLGSGSASADLPSLPASFAREAAELAYGAAVTLLDGDTSPAATAARVSFVF